MSLKVYITIIKMNLIHVVSMVYFISFGWSAGNKQLFCVKLRGKGSWGGRFVWKGRIYLSICHQRSIKKYYKDEFHTCGLYDVFHKFGWSVESKGLFCAKLSAGNICLKSACLCLCLLFKFSFDIYLHLDYINQIKYKTILYLW